LDGPKPAAEELLAHMRHDKKAQGGRLTFILAKGIGNAFVSNDIEEGMVTEILTEA
jgi:3-dehydroquinate synthase